MSTQKANRPLSQRQLRVGETLRHALAEALGAGLIEQDLLARSLITVTQVRMSPDLKHATVFFTVSQKMKDQLKDIEESLKDASTDLKSNIARRAVLKFMPKLRFCHDATFEQANKIHQIMRSPHVLQDLEKEVG
ncbi:MAG: 30S ribosome-binding factor RbfA [bacterium]|nr:30S ribosome-binding factor RbfA [bacterium]